MPYFDSTAIRRAEYEAQERLLLLWFAGDQQPYGYRDVPEDVFEALCQAESQGRFFAAHIRERYDLVPPP